MKLERPVILKSETHKIKIVGQVEITLYMTVGIYEGNPFEIFLNTKDATITEHLIATTVLVSKMLRCGIPVHEITEELSQIASPFTGHMKKGGWCNSLYARIAEVLDTYAESKNGDDSTETEHY